MELEMQPEFDGFNDRLSTFDLWKGKKTGDPNIDEKKFSGKFKVTIFSTVLYGYSTFRFLNFIVRIKGAKCPNHNNLLVVIKIIIDRDKKKREILVKVVFFVVLYPSL